MKTVVSIFNLMTLSLPSQPFEEIVEKSIPTDITINCVLAWQIYLIKLIVFRLNHTEYGVFDREDKNWKQLITLLNAVYNDADDDTVNAKLLDIQGQLGAKNATSILRVIIYVSIAKTALSTAVNLIVLIFPLIHNPHLIV